MATEDHHPPGSRSSKGSSFESLDSVATSSTILSESDTDDEQQVEKLTKTLEKTSMAEEESKGVENPFYYEVVAKGDATAIDFPSQNLDSSVGNQAMESLSVKLYDEEEITNQQLLQGQYGVPPLRSIDADQHVDPGNYVLVSIAQPTNLCDCRKHLDELYLKWFEKMASVLSSLR